MEPLHFDTAPAPTSQDAGYGSGANSNSVNFHLFKNVLEKCIELFHITSMNSSPFTFTFLNIEYTKKCLDLLRELELDTGVGAARFLGLLLKTKRPWLHITAKEGGDFLPSNSICFNSSRYQVTSLRKGLLI